MDLVIAALVLLFAIFSAVLLLSKVERHLGVFFVIRSGLGLRLIESIARFRPRLWEFLADLSVLISFGGLGAFYLSSNRETREGLYRSFLLMGSLFSLGAVFLWRLDIALSLFALSLTLTYLMRKLRRVELDFIFASIMFFFGFRMFADILTSLLVGVFGLPAALIYLMSNHGLNILSAKTNIPGVSPMLPSTRGGNVGVSFPGYDLFVPWWYALIALFITLVAHEGAHGILTRTAKVRLKSTGVLSFLSMPIGAFVEPDEEELNAKSTVVKMRVFAVGSSANLAVGLAAVFLMLALTAIFSAFMYSDGMRVVGFMEGFPAGGVIPAETIIYSVNGMPTTDFPSYRNVTGKLKPGMYASLNTSSGLYNIRLAPNPEDPGRGFIGVYLMENLHVRGSAGAFLNIALASFLVELLGWIAFFNVNIALVNLLPVIPFDGGRMFKELVSAMRLSELNVNRVLYAMVVFTAVLFIVNVIPLLRMVLQFAFTLI